MNNEHAETQGGAKALHVLFLLVMFAIIYTGGYLSFEATLAYNTDLTDQINELTSTLDIEFKSIELFLNIANIISITVTIIVSLVINVIILKILKAKVHGMTLATATLAALAVVYATVYFLMAFIPAGFPQIAISVVTNILEIVVLTCMLLKHLSRNRATLKFVIIRTCLSLLTVVGINFLFPLVTANA